MKRLVAYDLDGTLAPSKSSIDSETAGILADLLGTVKVAVISGGGWPQFDKQLVSKLDPKSDLSNLSILPTCGTKFFQYEQGWKELYSEDLTPEQRDSIIDSLKKVIDQVGLKPEKLWGPQIEDRGSQVTFSALGQEAPLEVKEKWDPDLSKRLQIREALTRLIPGFSVRLGGTTSLDITKPGVDKSYGIRKLSEVLDVPRAEMLFVGDALFPGGNDYPVEKAGVDSIRVRDPEETKRVTEAVIACLRNGSGS